MAFDGLTMNPEDKKKWIEALESGNFQQGRGKLKARNLKSKKVVYCCMGVLCEIQGLESEYSSEVEYDKKPYKFKFALGIANEGYPDKDWFGQFFEVDDDSFPKGVRIDGLMERLGEFNDEDKKRFKTIAKWIRENL